jgi:hypothetical protein
MVFLIRAHLIIKTQIMKENFKISGTFRLITLMLIAAGICSLVYGLMNDPKRAWANYLVVNYYFFSISIGAAFFLVIQVISQSGWSSGFRRIPEAMMSYIPLAGIFFILLYFGIHELYHWSYDEEMAHDLGLQHKSHYLNIPFFLIRTMIFFALWIIFTRILRKLSLKQDQLDPADQNSILMNFNKTELYSKILIFILAITFSLSTIDWIMSIDAHWYSTIFALKNLVAAFLHGVTIIILILFILRGRGHFSFLNQYHLHDFARYLFMLATIWGYFWFAQFMIIWYGNIPEETSYYFFRWEGNWKVLFFLEIGINWAVPFFILLPVKTSRNMIVITAVVIFLILGQYIDLFLQVMPGTTGKLQFGVIEAGIYCGYLGLFALVTGFALSKARIIPANHPYIEESIQHRF